MLRLPTRGSRKGLQVEGIAWQKLGSKEGQRGAEAPQRSVLGSGLSRFCPSSDESDRGGIGSPDGLARGFAWEVYPVPLSPLLGRAPSSQFPRLSPGATCSHLPGRFHGASRPREMKSLLIHSNPAAVAPPGSEVLSPPSL